MDEKLHRFIKGALTNPRHPVYQFQQTPILQHYAVNVKGCGLLEAVTPEQWENDYPVYAEKMKQVMALCESEEPPGVPEIVAPAIDEVGILKAELAALKTEIAELKKPKADAEKPDETPAE